jgi:hypothetical protein
MFPPIGNHRRFAEKTDQDEKWTRESWFHFESPFGEFMVDW